MKHVILMVALPVCGVPESPLNKVAVAPILTINEMACRRLTVLVERLDGSIAASLLDAGHQHFVYNENVNVDTPGDLAVSGIAAVIGEPARVRILYCLLDGHARTSTELAVVADVSPSTASVHLSRLKTANLVTMLAQGKHRYYSLKGPDVARVLEGLRILAGASPRGFVPNTPSRLRTARTCYDHIAGTVGVLLHNRFRSLGWLSARSSAKGEVYDVTLSGTRAVQALGIDLAATRSLRRRFAYACLDWSERQPHIGGALGAALLKTALTRKWMIQDLDSRALRLTNFGQRELLARFGLQL